MDTAQIQRDTTNTDDRRGSASRTTRATVHSPPGCTHVPPTPRTLPSRPRRDRRRWQRRS
eukprot:4462666-Prymnesium_polylepis.1